MARSSAGSAAASRATNTASAACARSAGSGEKSLSAPSAAATALRTGLFIRTWRSPLAITSGAGFPLAASSSAPSSFLMNSALSLVRA